MTTKWPASERVDDKIFLKNENTGSTIIWGCGRDESCYISIKVEASFGM